MTYLEQKLGDCEEGGTLPRLVVPTSLHEAPEGRRAVPRSVQRRVLIHHKPNHLLVGAILCVEEKKEEKKEKDEREEDESRQLVYLYIWKFGSY